MKNAAIITNGFVLKSLYLEADRNFENAITRRKHLAHFNALWNLFTPSEVKCYRQGDDNSVQGSWCYRGRVSKERHYQNILRCEETDWFSFNYKTINLHFVQRLNSIFLAPRNKTTIIWSKKKWHPCRTLFEMHLNALVTSNAHSIESKHGKKNLKNEPKQTNCWGPCNV